MIGGPTCERSERFFLKIRTKIEVRDENDQVEHIPALMLHLTVWPRGRTMICSSLARHTLLAEQNEVFQHRYKHNGAKLEAFRIRNVVQDQATKYLMSGCVKRDHSATKLEILSA